MSGALKATRPATATLPKFQLGQKQVFLPSFVITFLHRPDLPPNEARFKVPLTFTKFDLRDYLWNLYGVETTDVRSMVIQRSLKLRAGSRNRLYRPQADKHMIATLSKGFQYPKLPSDREAWGGDIFDQREAQRKQMQKEQGQTQKGEIPMKSREGKSDKRKSLAALAKKTFYTKEWSNDLKLDPRWDGFVTAAPAKKKGSKQKDGNTKVEKKENIQ